MLLVDVGVPLKPKRMEIRIVTARHWKPSNSCLKRSEFENARNSADFDIALAPLWVFPYRLATPLALRRRAPTASEHTNRFDMDVGETSRVPGPHFGQVSPDAAAPCAVMLPSRVAAAMELTRDWLLEIGRAHV